MAKLIPPASVLYFPNAPIIFSAPVRQKASISDPSKIITLLSLYTYDSGTVALIYLPSAGAWYDICTIFLLAPGDYKITWQYCDILNKQYRLLLNDVVIDGPVGENSSNLITRTVNILNVPGYSKLKLQGYSPSGISVYIANVILQSSPPGDARLLSSAPVAGTNTYTTTQSSTSGSPNANAPQPPPIRDTSNIPVKRKGGWLV
jgi:hypothetical protein